MARVRVMARVMNVVRVRIRFRVGVRYRFFETLMTTGTKPGSERCYPRPWLARPKSLIG